MSPRKVAVKKKPTGTKVSDSKTPQKKRSRVVLSLGEKKALCQHKRLFPNKRYEELAKWLFEYCGKSVALNTIGDIVRKADTWLETSDDAETLHKQSTAQYPKLEDALYLWFSQERATNPNIYISDDVLIEKAKRLGEDLGVSGLQYSHGWCCRFRKRHGMRSFRVHGESASVSQTTLNVGRCQIRTNLTGFDPENIYNLDETGLLYELQAAKTMATGPVKGTKESKKRITIVLCCNATGSDKRKPLVIAQSKNPRCFKNWNPKPYVDYTSNRKAWVTSLEFKDYVESFDKWAKKKNKNLILLVDNAPSHKQIKLDNVLLIFLPPNTTSVLQPLDAGIIRSFKAKYRVQLNSFLLDCLEEKRPTKVDLRQAIIMVRHSWDNVTQQCIQNCWRHTEILPVDECDPIAQESDETQPLNDIDGVNELRSILKKIPECVDIDVDAYLDVDATLPTQEQMTDAEICQFVTQDIQETDLPEEEDYEPPPPIKTSAAKWMCRDLVRYFEEKGRPEHANQVWDIYRRIETLGHDTVQTSITDFFKPSL